MLNEQDRESVIAYLGNQLVKLGGLIRVHSGSRFIQQQDGRFGCQGACNFKPALGSVGQVLGKLVDHVGQAYFFKNRVGQGNDLFFFPYRFPVSKNGSQHLGPGPAVTADHHVFQHSHVGKEPDVLKGPGKTLLGYLVGLQSVQSPSGKTGRGEQQVARGWFVDTGQTVEKGGLSCAVWADKGNNFALPDAQVQVIKCPDAAKVHSQPAHFQDGLIRCSMRCHWTFVSGFLSRV